MEAPLAARGFQPGQFYRLQNYEALATRVGGTKLVATPRTAAYSLPVSSSNAARRDSSYSEQAEKRLAQRGAAKLMLQRSSFFGMRGGNTALAKR